MNSLCSHCARVFIRFVCMAGLISVLVPVVSFSAEPSTSAFEAANKMYDEGKYAEAAAAFERLSQSGQASAAVYFNLGNAYFKSGQLGRAIAAYSRSEELAPRDQDVHANLQFARNQVQGPTLASNRWQQFLNKLTVNEWTVAACGLVWIWLLLLVLSQCKPSLKSTLRNYIIGTGIIAGLTCACFGGSYAEARSGRRAFVVARDAVVHNGPLDESPNAFTVHDGAELRVLDQKDEWLQVSAGNRMGWLKKNDVVLQ
jgi:tetratricopeptide (TPR) repeat protein